MEAHRSARQDSFRCSEIDLHRRPEIVSIIISDFLMAVEKELTKGGFITEMSHPISALCSSTKFHAAGVGKIKIRHIVLSIDIGAHPFQPASSTRGTQWAIWAPCRQAL